MRIEYRYSYCRSGDLYFIVAEYLLRLFYHLFLFFGISVREEYVDLRNYVIEYSVRELLRRCVGVRDSFFEVVISCDSRARYRLIRRVNYSFYAVLIVKRFDREHSLYGRAVRICDNAVIPVDIVGVYLGNYQRNVVAHTPLTRVVYDRRAAFYEYGSKSCRRRAACREESYIHFIFLDVFIGKFYNRVGFSHKVYDFSRALGGSEKVVVLNGEITLRENFEELISDHTGRADYGYVKLFHILPPSNKKAVTTLT